MRLFFREYGDNNAIPLFLIHGLYGCSDNWIPFAKIFAKKGFKVVVPDIRNHGNSPHSDKHTFSLMAEDIINLSKELGIEKACCIGHSMGANVALRIAIDFPNFFAKIVMIDNLPKDYVTSKSTQIRESVDLFKLMNELDLNIFSTYTEIDEYLKKFIDKESYRFFLLKNIKKEENVFSWRCNVSIFEELIREIGYFGKLKNPINTKMLILKGEKSDFIDESDFPFISKYFPNAKVVVVKDSKHWLHVQQPEIFINESLIFLQN